MVCRRPVPIRVVLGSPDGQMRVLLGDSNLGTFIEPNQMMAYAGLREGGYCGLGDGSQLLTERYLAGQQFAQTQAPTYVSSECAGLQIALNSAPPDLAETFLPAARAKGMPRRRLMAGDITFTCTIGDTAGQGTVVAAMVPLFTGSRACGTLSAVRLLGDAGAAQSERQYDTKLPGQPVPRHAREGVPALSRSEL